MSAYPQSENPLGKKEKNAILIGFLLIICVFVFTLFRSLGGSKPSITQADSESTSQIAPNYDTISSLELTTLLNAKSDLTLLDIRSFDDYIQTHLLDSLNVPADEIASSDKIKPENKFIIIGSTSNDSAVDKAVTALKNKGAADVKVLAGGLVAWQAKGGQTVSFGDPTSFVDQSKVFYLDAPKAQAMLQNDQAKTLVLDVRDESDFSQGHVAGAINIPLLDLEKRRNEIPSLKNILLFGVTDVAEFQAGVQLHDMKQINAYVVKGGLKAWQEAKFEVIK